MAVRAYDRVRSAEVMNLEEWVRNEGRLITQDLLPSATHATASHDARNGPRGLLEGDSGHARQNTTLPQGGGGGPDEPPWTPTIPYPA